MPARGEMRLDNLTPPPWIWPRAAYIHVPFCAHHCGYCDFAVVAGKEAQIGRYLNALEAELAMLREPRPVETIYVGGGTPTHPAPEEIAQLLALIGRWLPPGDRAEWSVEANPATLTAEKVAVLAEHGVNRVSLGAQSFQREALQVLERDHQAAN